MIKKLLRSHKSMQFLSQYNLSDLSKLDFQKCINVDMNIQRDGSYLIKVPSLIEDQGDVKLIVEPEFSFQDLIEGFNEKLPQFGKMEAYTYNKVQIATSTLLGDMSDQNYYLISGQNFIFDVKNQDKPILDEYKQLTDYSNNIDLSFLERKILINYLKRFDDLNQQTFGNKVFSDDAAPDKIYQKEDIILNLISAIPEQRNVQTEYEDKLYEQYETLGKKLAVLKNRKEQLQQMAKKSEKRKMLIGLVALVGQFGFVAAGTYSIWSWDIVEPMAYFLTSTGQIYLAIQFFKFYDDYNNQTYLEWRTDRSLAKLAKRANLDLLALEDMEDQFKQLEKKIKSNFLLNL